MTLFALPLGIGTAFFVVGWLVDPLARKQTAAAGLAWAAVTFVVPALVWIVASLAVYQHGSESTGLVFMVGYMSSLLLLIAGTLTARKVSRLRGIR